MTAAPASRNSSALRAGDFVEVKSAAEILATLDERGRLDGLPFMPEMLQFCGQRFRVQSRAHKTCDTVNASGYRRLDRTVHLAELRCDGSSHGGCQAACLLWWKEAWVRPVESATEAPGTNGTDRSAHTTTEMLEAATRGERTESGEETYSCQATELREATTPLPWWDARQYVEDVSSGNVSVWRLAKGLLILLLNKFQAANRAYLPALTPINGGRRYPFVAGALDGKTPTGSPLNLQPGEWVRIKSKEEIEKTLDRNNKNRGLMFDGVMSKYCGQTAKVRARVTTIVNEQNGTMRHLPNEAIMLEGVVCTGDYMQFCPRRIYPFWRENWLERI